MLFEDSLACSGVANLSWPGSQETQKMSGTKGQWLLKCSIYDFMDVMNTPHSIFLIFASFNSKHSCLYESAKSLTANSSVVVIQRQNYKTKPFRISHSMIIPCYFASSIRLKLGTPDTYWYQTPRSCRLFLEFWQSTSFILINPGKGWF